MTQSIVKKLEKQFEDLQMLIRESYKRFIETCVWTNAKLYDLVSSDIDQKLLELEFDAFCDASWQNYQEVLNDNNCVIQHLNNTSTFCVLHKNLEKSELKPEMQLDDFVDAIARRSETHNDLYYDNCFNDQDLESTIELWEGNDYDISEISDCVENFKEELERLNNYLENMRTCYEVLNNFKANQVKEFKNYALDQLSFEFDNIYNDVQTVGQRLAELVTSEIYEHAPVQQRLEEYLHFFRELNDNVLKSYEDWSEITYDDNLKVVKLEYTLAALESKMEEVGQLVNNLQGSE